MTFNFSHKWTINILLDATDRHQYFLFIVFQGTWKDCASAFLSGCDHVILLDVANCIPCFPWMLGVSLTMSYIAAWWIFIWVKFKTKVVLNMTSLRVGVWYRCIPCIPRLYQLWEKPNAWPLTWELDVFRATLLSAFIMRILWHSRNFCTSNVVERSQPY